MTEPTDAEILELASQYWYCLDETESATEIELVRAALAKWGTPQPVAREPLTNEQRMEVFNEAMKRCDENLNLPWRVAILEQVEIAHGITQKGASNADTGTN